MVSSRIFASGERQKVLDDYGIKYYADENLNLAFEDEKTKRKAVKIMKDALVY